jgi:SAM-dependent methyltransferase
MTPAEYWQQNDTLQHITPAGIEWPEVELPDALRKACTGSVFEFGCGYGRLAGVFSPTKYVGFDINPAALKEAHKRRPDHVFGSEWVDADTFLAYTVLLHVPDDEIGGILDAAKSQYKRIVIGEIMGRQWRRPGNPPVFNRDAQEYADLIGWDCAVIKVSYPRYGCDLDLMVFNRD